MCCVIREQFTQRNKDIFWAPGTDLIEEIDVDRQQSASPGLQLVDRGVKGLLWVPSLCEKSIYV